MSDEGLRYYVARDLLEVDARVTKRRQVVWKAEGDQDCKPHALDPRWLQTRWNVSVSTVADRNRVYRLALDPSSSAAQSLRVTVSESGLLSAFNYSAEDKRGEIIVSVLRGVAGIAGTVVGLAPTLGEPDITADAQRDSTAPSMADSQAVDPGECFRRSSRQAAALLEAHGVLETEIKDTQAARARILAEAESPGLSSPALRRLRDRDDMLQRRVAVLTGRLEVVRAEIASGMATHAAQHGVGVTDSVVQVVTTLDLAEVPPDSLLLRATPLTFDAARAILVRANRTAAVTLLDRAKLLLVLGHLPPSATARPAPDSRDGSLGCREVEDEADCVRIRFRESIPRVLKVFVPDSASATDAAPPPRGPSNAILRQRETRTIPLMSSADPILNVAFPAKALGKRLVNLTFGNRGNLVGVEQTSDAPNAALASTLAASVGSARQEFLAGLQGVQTAQAGVLAIQNAERGAKIKQLLDRKALLDARLVLEGAEANRDLLAEKQILDAQLQLLQSQQDLATAQETSATSGELATLRGELERLRLELELVQKQLAIEKARRELNDLQPSP
ncbi:MAG: hypothetical protein H0V09_11025 [Gemmatimonadetes bacterium]|nr:hypothetical protein [Gemmatimonadota bacterium]